MRKQLKNIDNFHSSLTLATDQWEITDCIDAAIYDITLHNSRIGDVYGQEDPQSDRQARGLARAHASDDVEHESGEARRRPWPHLPASAEIREGHQPHRRQPPAANFQYPASAGFIFLRRRAEYAGAYRHGRSAVAGLCVGLPRHLRRSLAHQVVHEDQERQITPAHCRSGRADRGRGQIGPVPSSPNALPTAARILTLCTVTARTTGEMTRP